MTLKINIKSREISAPNGEDIQARMQSFVCDSPLNSEQAAESGPPVTESKTAQQ